MIKRYKSIFFCVSLCVLSSTLVYSQGIPSASFPELRAGIFVTQTEIDIALEMRAQKWKYVMPIPKSPQAGWHNSDRRTTWYLGYWRRGFFVFSSVPPTKDENGNYVGDGIREKGYYRRGGRPRQPTALEYLMSKRGGVKPS